MNSAKVIKYVERSMLGLVLSPLIVVIAAGIFSGDITDSDKNQWMGLQVILMYVYTVPFVGVALLARWMLGIFEESQVASWFIASAIVAFVACLGGVALMVGWTVVGVKA